MNVTHRFQRFREAARHLWNTEYMPLCTAEFDLDIRNAFSEVYVALFKSLVCSQLPGTPQPIPPFRQQPGNCLSQYKIVGEGSQVLIMINRDSPPEGYWDHPIKCLYPPTTDLRLIQFFDFGETGLLDLPYYRVRIRASEHPEIVGRDALVEVQACRVIYEQES